MNTFQGNHIGHRLGTAISALALLIALVAGAAAHAATTFSWTGAASNLWSNPNNWNPVGTPSNGDLVAFPSGASNPSNQNDLVGLSLRGLAFTGGSYTIGGNALSITSTISSTSSVPLLNLPLDLGASAITVSGGPVNMAGAVSGTGSITLSGNAELRLSGTSTFSGTLNSCGPSSCGTVHLIGGSWPAATGALSSGLLGNGTIGAVTVGQDLFMDSTGSGFRIINTGDLVLNSVQYTVRLLGPGVGTGYDQLNVTGSVVLTSAKLNLSLSSSFVPSAGQVFTIINNDGTDAVSGTFQGLPEGSIITINGLQFFLSYVGGSGNDVTITPLNGKQSPTVTLTSSVNPASPGALVTFTATVSAATATGTVTFFDGTTNLGAASLSAGVATLSTAALAVGTHSITAEYGGDASFGGVVSSTLSEVVNKHSTTTSVASSGNPAEIGASVTFTATVSSSGGTPTGSITLRDGASVLATVALTNGSASYSTSSLAFGSHTITANYLGDLTRDTSSGTLSGGQTIRDTVPPDTRITSTPASLTNSPSASFSFDGSDIGTGVQSFACSLDGGGFVACSSPKSYTSLASGGHTFAVRAIDVAGNTDATPATFAWTVDLGAPTLAITTKPAITSANQAAYSVAGTCSDDGRTVGVQIGSIATTGTCGTPASGRFATIAVSVSALPQGAVNLTASTSDAAGNTTSVTDTTIKDTVGPSVNIGVLDTINNANKASYAFAGNCESGGGTVSYSLSAGASLTGAVPCTGGGYAVTGLGLTGFNDGTVNVQVSQADSVGNTTTTSGSVGKDTVNPTVVLDAPAIITAANQSSYRVSGTCSESGRPIVVALGSVNASASCGAPGVGLFQLMVDVAALPDGQVTIAASASDAAGNTATASASVTKFTVAAGRMSAVSTRAVVLGGDGVVIGGFVVGGVVPKRVLVRARGPSLADLGVSGVLANPMLQLFSTSGLMDTNDDWRASAAAAEISALGMAPSDPRESAIIATLPPGAYTAIVSGVGSTGVGIVEFLEIDHPESPFVALSTRAQIRSGDAALIAGFVLEGSAPRTVVVRARGPSMADQLANVLANPSLELVRASDGALVGSNDDWATALNAAQLSASGFAPGNRLESAILVTLEPGAYTAVVRGVGGTTGVAIVEVFPQ